MYISPFPLNLLNNDDGGKTKVCFVCCMYQRIIRDINTYRFFEYSNIFLVRSHRNHMFFSFSTHLKNGYGIATKLAQDVTALAQDVETLAQDVTAVAQDVTTVAQDVTTVAQDVTTVAQDVTTVAQDVTIVAQDVTTVAQDVTTLASRSSLLLLKASFLTAKFAVDWWMLMGKLPDTFICLVSLF